MCTGGEDRYKKGNAHRKVLYLDRTVRITDEGVPLDTLGCRRVLPKIRRPLHHNAVSAVCVHRNVFGFFGQDVTRPLAGVRFSGFLFARHNGSEE